MSWQRSAIAIVTMVIMAATGGMLPGAPQREPQPGTGNPPSKRESSSKATGWERHTIDSSSVGADGVRLGDLNRDGRPDIVTGWEEGGKIRVYLHPGSRAVRGQWPAVTVGQVASPEDAVFADLDGDGLLDVISSTEGSDRSIYFHWAPEMANLEKSAKWKTAALPGAKKRMRWMFALPRDIDHANGVDLFAGGKDANAAVGWFEAPASPRDLDAWEWHPLREMGWLMSLIGADMDGDGDLDLLLSDRKGPRRGVLWLENPGTEKRSSPWREHSVSLKGRDEVMFLTYADLDGDGLEDIISAVKPQHLEFYRRLSSQGEFAAPVRIPFPPNTGSAKGVAIGDLNGDGLADLVFSCEHAEGEKRGVMGLLATRGGDITARLPVDISGEAGAKFDLVQMVDLDGDGDLDVLSCEETENLGVFWYENPGP